MTTIGIAEELYVPAERFGFRSQYHVGYQGNVWKRGHYIKNWKKRFVVLRSNLLKYYSDESRTTLKGTVVIDDTCTVKEGVDGWEGRFNVIVLKSCAAELYLSLDSVADRNAWLEAIQDAINCGLPHVLHPELSWPKFQVSCILDAVFGHTPVQDGNLIKPAQMRKPPSVYCAFREPPEVSDRFLLLAFDLDYPSRKSPKHGRYLLWMVANIHRSQEAGSPSEAIGSVKPSCVLRSSSGQTVIDYHPAKPSLGSGLHRVFFLLYKQGREVQSSESYFQQVHEQRWPFVVSQCVEALELVAPLGVDGCYTDWDDSCTEPYPSPSSTAAAAETSPPSPSQSPSLSSSPPPPSSPSLFPPSPPRGRGLSPAEVDSGEESDMDRRLSWSPTPLQKRDLLHPLPNGKAMSPSSANSPPQLQPQEQVVALPEPSPSENQARDRLLDLHLLISDEHLLPGHASLPSAGEWTSPSQSSSMTVPPASSSSFTTADPTAPSVALPSVSFSSFVMVSSPSGTSVVSSPDRSHGEAKKLVSALKRPTAAGASHIKRKSVSFNLREVEARIIDNHIPEEVELDMLDYDQETADYSLDYQTPSSSSSSLTSSSSLAGGSSAGHHRHHHHHHPPSSSRATGVSVPMKPIIRGQASTVSSPRDGPSSGGEEPKGETGSATSGQGQRRRKKKAVVVSPDMALDSQLSLRSSINLQASDAGVTSHDSVEVLVDDTPLDGEGLDAEDEDEEALRDSGDVTGLPWTKRVDLMHSMLCINAPVLLPGGLLKKRFGTDFTFKDSFMWIDLRSLSLHWAKSVGDKDNGSRQKHVRFPMPASAANAYMPPRGEFKGSVVAVTREDWIVSCSLEPAQTLKIKLNNLDQAKHYEMALQRLLEMCLAD